MFGVILGAILGAVLAPKRGEHKSLENLDFCSQYSTFLNFLRSQGLEIDQTVVRTQHPAETSFQERLGRLQGPMLEPFGGHFGSQNRSGKGSQNQLEF